MDLEILRRAIADPAVFAEVLCGSPLWPHQQEILASPARYRVICAGRQSGKSRTLAIAALHQAYTKPGSRVLIVSAGEVAAERLLADIAGLATGSPMLAGSVLDELKGSVTLSNASVILSTPASQKQVRGWATDLLVLDEAAFLDQALWRAAEPTIIARSGSRVILTSTPWGGHDHFFSTLWRRGMDRPDLQVQAWHWPSSISPLVDRTLLEEIQARESPDYFAREFMAEWTDETGSYFTEAEIMGAVADYEMLSPERVAELNPWDPWDKKYVRRWPVAAGIDWGFSVDSHALCLVGLLDDHGANARRTWWIPWIESHARMEYSAMVRRIGTVAEAYHLYVVGTETNGVGASPSQDLRRLLHDRQTGSHVIPIWTDARRKQSGFGKIKGLLQTGELILPRHPDLLRELRGLEYTLLPSGMTRIAAGGRGHDDLSLSLLQACSAVQPGDNPQASIWAGGDFEHTTTPRGTVVPRRPVPVERYTSGFIAPEGHERSAEAAWG